MTAVWTWKAHTIGEALASYGATGLESGLTFGHPVAGGFEDFALLVSEAVNAMGGDFIEDGVYFFADKFFIHGR